MNKTYHQELLESIADVHMDLYRRTSENSETTQELNSELIKCRVELDASLEREKMLLEENARIQQQLLSKETQLNSLKEQLEMANFTSGWLQSDVTSLQQEHQIHALQLSNKMLLSFIGNDNAKVIQMLTHQLSCCILLNVTLEATVKELMITVQDEKEKKEMRNRNMKKLNRSSILYFDQRDARPLSILQMDENDEKEALSWLEGDDWEL